ncbi:MAG: tetratricopeptide repeat-containing sensor histidine kinase [Chryseobacterium sp.]|nr:tetratricopeptide repeat-containing sensor histidine kinase [Chryseobacterium sp.]
MGKCLTNLAIIQETKGDYFGSQETGLSALKYFNENDSLQHNYLSINYNTLSLVSSKLKNYTQATGFFEKAIAFANDKSNKIIYENNLAINYKEQKQYQKAISIFENLIKNNHTDSVIYVKSRIIDNLSFTKWLQNPNYNPIPEFQQALNIRIKDNDLWGQNASYAHLADYYSRKKNDSSLFYAKKMFDVANQIKSPDDQIEALQKLIILDSKNYSLYFNRYQFLTDSLQTVRNKAKNQFALIRYETEKNKADFLKAKAENIEKQNKIIIRNIALIVALLVLIGFYIYLRRRQRRLQQEKLLEVKNTELRYSKKVHDKVANRIYQLMSQVENKEVIDRDSLLFGLENAYETSRDISYNNKEINENQSFSEQLHKMLDSYSSDFVKLIFNGNNEKLWEGISFQNKTEVYLVLQELMTNMKKHSQANIVSIKFSRENSKINISYTDNGIGIENFSPKNGLQNMENRINSINGTIIFDTETNNLLKINISFPV